jgi:hypothetical protein
LILVDSSVWIEFINSSSSRASRELGRLIGEDAPVALTGVIVTEVLQGLLRDVTRVAWYLSTFAMLEPSGFSTYREAAAISRSARSKGFSVATLDTLIAAIAIENEVTLFTLDMDFTHIARITKLQLHALPEF